MSVMTREKGLCSTCMHAAVCTFPRFNGAPVLQCDEFCGYPPQATCFLGRCFESSPEKPSDDLCYKGLCCNCDNREACTFREPGRRVLTCDEYC